MAARHDRGSSTSAGSSNRSFSRGQVEAFSSENDDKISEGRQSTASRDVRSGMAAVRASERFHSSKLLRGGETARSATSRAGAENSTALRAIESPLMSSGHRDDTGKDANNTANRVRSFSGSSSDRDSYIVADDTRRLEEGNRTLSISQSKTASTQSLAETRSNGDASKSRRNKDVGLLGALRTLLFGARDPESDLSIEMLEELHMVTGFTYKELRITRSHFLALVKDASFITREEFLEIPSVANNPLRERLLVCFGFDSMDNLKFKEFVEILSIFNNPSAQRDQKLRMAFTLVDIDGDGLVSKNDLVRYLDLITAAPEGVKLDLNAVAARVIEEGVSTPGAKSLSLADFIKIMGAADFADKLTIPL